MRTFLSLIISTHVCGVVCFDFSVKSHPNRYRKNHVVKLAFKTEINQTKSM